MSGFILCFLCFALMATVTSVNVNGLRNMEKVKELVYVYRSDILCLQETNWDGVVMKDVRKEWEGGIFYNNGARNARGVAIMLKKDKVENVKEVYKDSTGRILVI